VTDPDRPEGILGRIRAPEPDRRAPSSSIDVLLVHPDERFTFKVTGLLRKHAYSVVEVPDAAAAVETVRQGCVPRLVVLDLDGASREDLAALAALQAGGPGGGAAFLTLSRTGGDAPPGLRCDEGLLKPIEAAELVAAVRRLCGPG
jgi:DNA-binding response OmpR family regulator